MQLPSSIRALSQRVARRASIGFLTAYTSCNLSIACAQAAYDDLRTAGVHRDVVFDTYSPLATSEELARRLLRPLVAERVRAQIDAKPGAVREQSIDLAAERFSYYVPRGAPPAAGYGVLVYVPPWNEAKILPAWILSLDRHAMIAVTMANAGNDEDVIDRRVPLALSAYANIAKRFRIDASRVYVGGFSGGSRVALRIALGYSDVFCGVLLNAGSDTFGSAELPLPSQALEDTFEDRSRVVYVTGSQDVPHLAMDEHSRESARDNCVADVTTLSWRNAGHQPIDREAFEHALQAFDTKPADRSSDIEQCRTHRTAEMDKRIADARLLIASGQTESARRELDAIDVRYGGLAMPQSLQLSDQLALHAANPMPASSRR